MGALIRAIDWTETGLGAIETWPQSLQTAVSICLFSQFPIHIWWGPEFVEIYNDAYRPILGSAKHPASMGQRGEVTSAEIWHIIGPMLRNVYENAVSTWSENLMLPMDRYGFTEETYFTLSYSPIFVEAGNVGGVFTVVTETTRQVLGERRLRTLHRLSEHTSDAKTAEDACRRAGETLSENREDVPFSLIYLLNEPGTQAQLVGSSGIETHLELNPPVIDLSNDSTSPWQLSDVLATSQYIHITNLTSRFSTLPPSPWEEHTHTALVLPISSSGVGKITGFLIGGISARLQLDEEYQHFYELIAGHVASAIANARAYEDERKRADALAELDHAKTEFFSNISHEFRTPLTLMLNPVQDMLNGQIGSLSPDVHQHLEVIHRNNLRLLKLVNTLLDFSRIQSNRIQASFEPTDLAELTTDLASMFRSAVERAGLRYSVQCASLPEPVYVDQEMWEKIVLNLLSNAFKFTFEGEIEVRLQAVNDHVELSVRDTGVGIAPHHLDRIFERFSRIQGVKSRTHEGSGIGLSLVEELVHFHDGQIRVASVLGVGSTFTVSIPLGHSHLPSEQIGGLSRFTSTSSGALSYIQEALGWLSDETAINPSGVTDQPISDPEMFGIQTFHILIADDNTDMRGYLQRLLEKRYRVDVVSDGVAALAFARLHTPDLIIADVMMPNLDGIQLVQEIRSSSQGPQTPIILVSARAGEEAQIEGLLTGADDYLVKPFSARELMARVEGQLKLAQLRREIDRSKQEVQARYARMLRRSNEELQQFTYIVSHDLQEPLRTITSYLQLLEKRYASQFDNDGHEFLNFAIEGAARMKELINDLLTLSRIEGSEKALEEVSVQSALDRALANLQQQIEEKNARITQDAMPTLKVDGVHLTQVFQNLIGNAIKFQRDEAPEVHIGVEHKGDEWEFYVRDNGIGIAPEHLERIFRIFQRLHLASEYPGTGIGLAICKKVVERHGGRMWVESISGQGTTFYFTLPG